MSKKHSWNMVKQINTSKESGNKQPYQQNRIYDIDGIIPTLNVGNGGNTVHKVIAQRGRGKNNEQVLEESKGDFTNTITGVTKNNLLLDNTPTLSGFEHGTNGQLDRQLLKGGMIRRLTEIECERLQGYKDNWTEYGIYEKQVWINKKEKTFRIVEGKEKISRTQRYKLCGNAVTSDIVELIGKKLLNL